MVQQLEKRGLSDGLAVELENFEAERVLLGFAICDNGRVKWRYHVDLFARFRTCTPAVNVSVA